MDFPAATNKSVVTVLERMLNWVCASFQRSRAWADPLLPRTLPTLYQKEGHLDASALSGVYGLAENQALESLEAVLSQVEM